MGRRFLGGTLNTRGRRILGVFEGEQAPFGWKHPRACSWRDL